MSDQKERLLRIMGTFDLATGHAETWDELLDSLESELRDVLGHYRAAREWVSLTREEVLDLADAETHPLEFVRSIETRLKEKNR